MLSAPISGGRGGVGCWDKHGAEPYAVDSEQRAKPSWDDVVHCEVEPKEGLSRELKAEAEEASLRCIDLLPWLN